jgi:misacylated tRNA(Ala) deacylase
MTAELFRDDSYLRTCAARVVRADETGIVLDQTVFYPEGGGQPGDCGTLAVGRDRISIVGTRKGPNGDILHLPAPGSPTLAAGLEVTAEIDWALRYAHMRMHTCLHLLCALIPYPVTGGALTRDKGRLDFDMEQGVNKEEIEAALNRLIEEDHQVSFKWITDREMQDNMDLVRTMSVKPPLGSGRVRLVEVAQVDLQPCGGTHVALTGEIGRVALGKIENKGKHNRRVHVVRAD